MKLSFLLEGLCCPNCAAKIEEDVAKFEGVREASVNFMTSKLRVDIDDKNASSLAAAVEKSVHKYESDIKIRQL